MKGNFKKGYITISVIVFASVFGMLMAGLTSFIFTQSRVQTVKENREQAIQIAEAGLDYYKWYLAHFPDDLQNGTGVPGPYEIAYNDPEGGEIGKFSLDIQGNEVCGITTSVDIESTGFTNEKPQFERVVSGKYSRPSVAEFSYIIDSNVWAGADREIFGPYHSNGGIRMDGTNHSTVSSAVEDWVCTSSFGCSPPQTKDGIFGSGPGFNLWKFPVTPVDFVGITVDLNNMKDVADKFGILLHSIGGESQRKGYHLVLNGDDTMDIYQVTKTSYSWSIHIDDINGGWKKDYQTIDKEKFLETKTIPSGCRLIYVQDKLWIDGVVNGKLTIAAAKIQSPNFDSDIILNGNITYTTPDGSDGLTLIAENSVLIPLIVPDDMVINGVFIAQKGYFGRNLYPCWYSPYDQRSSLTTNGTIVSSERVGTKWGYFTDSCGSNWSGFNERNNSYDRKLATDPPPLTPNFSNEFQFIEWREVE